ncbi:alpha-glucuronidase family glycosyl hydrolase [Emticicia sp. 21SJ11W-3]|uniref:alpha-glucuronidase family glycosyl hydrolase n=1 Tax=Emticicia sp. 21SJ11W-3 TaxID=2916755 RepID=UPI00209DA00D|nr:alpha-glucuronidase family glycosyl hydrolase [Emticicia sp. 21SJ11W-3]UTA70067.1 alpha-glucuronidase [Emticicia sp. 21SJ11W-3]
MIKKIFVLLMVFSLAARADDGSRLWLKFDLLKDPVLRTSYTSSTRFIVAHDESPIIKTAVTELQSGLGGLLGRRIQVYSKADTRTGGIILHLDNEAPLLIHDGFSIRSQKGNIVISARNPSGILYGTFELLRYIQTGKSLQNLNLVSNPKVKLRMLNHWDNANGTVERGYAGSSMWKWPELPFRIDPRYIQYARANASIGINAASINNVNASSRFLTAEYLEKIKAVADVLRPYGISVFISVNFRSPRTLGGLKTSDPLDPEVKKWWNEKTKEIHQYIPDFGGFLVKANSEGEPGPQDYGRTHADGANMLAEAMRPYKGIVIWRAFVYKADPNGDRFKEAYEQFKPLEGTFDPKVIVQVKNGPIDFMPREPFHPMFGAFPKTTLGMEFQITQEYLGQSTHLTYLAPMFKECLDADTYAKGKGSTVAKVIDGSLDGHQLSLMAGVANTGSDNNWTGHPFNQANWYAFGRLAWDYTLSSERIASEWIAMTITPNKVAQRKINEMMMRSLPIYISYTYPLGTAHMMGEGHHYGPEPWLEKSGRPDWTSVYYHRADTIGLGFDRTGKVSNALSLYQPDVQKIWGNPDNCPLDYLLWFHHVSWKMKLSTGRTLWDELCWRYYDGAEQVKVLQADWESLKPLIDKETYENVKGRLMIQEKEALWWRDACVLYFINYAKMPLPAPLKLPARSLDEVKKLVEIYHLR